MVAITTPQAGGAGYRSKVELYLVLALIAKKSRQSKKQTRTVSFLAVTERENTQITILTTSLMSSPEKSAEPGV